MLQYGKIQNLFSEAICSNTPTPSQIDQAFICWVKLSPNPKDKWYFRCSDSHSSRGVLVSAINHKTGEQFSQPIWEGQQQVSLTDEQRCFLAANRLAAERAEYNRASKRKSLDHIWEARDLGWQPNFGYFEQKKIIERDLFGLDYKFIYYGGTVAFVLFIHKAGQRQAVQLYYYCLKEKKWIKRFRNALKGGVVCQKLAPAPQTIFIVEGLATWIGFKKLHAQRVNKLAYHVYYALSSGRLSETVRLVRDIHGSSIKIVIIGDYDGGLDAPSFQQTAIATVEARGKLFMPAIEGEAKIDFWDRFSSSDDTLVEYEWDSTKLFQYVEKPMVARMIEHNRLKRFGVDNDCATLEAEDIKPDQVVESLEEILNDDFQGIKVMRLPMGSGKTRHVIKPAIARAAGVSVVVTPTRGLTLSCANVLDTGHYKKDLDRFTGIYWENTISICVNSIVNGHYYEILANTKLSVLEEFSQILKSIFFGTVRTPEKEKTLETIKSLIRAREVYISDADFDSTAVKFLQDLGIPFKIYGLSPEKPSSLAGCTYTIKNARVIDRRTKRDLAFSRVIELLQKGENVHVCSDARSNCNLLERAVRKKGITDIININGQNVNTAENQAFLENINTVKLPRLLITSPAISSGISIEQNHFTKGVVINLDYTLLPQEMRQMMHRCRPLRDFEIFWCCRLGNSDRVLLENKSLASAFEGLSAHQGDNILCNTDYMKLALAMRSTRIKKMRNWVGWFLGEAKQDGIKVIYEDPFDPLDDPDRHKEKVKTIRESLTTHRSDIKECAQAEATLNDEIIEKAETFDSDREYERFKHRAQGRKDYARLAKYRAQKALKTQDVSSKEVNFIERGGFVAIQNLCFLFKRQTEIEARELDVSRRTQGRESLVDTKWRESRCLIMNTLEKHLNLTSPEMAAWTPRETYLIAEELRRHRIVMDYIKVGLGLDINAQASRLVHNVIRKMLKIDIKAAPSERSFSIKNWQLSFSCYCKFAGTPLYSIESEFQQLNEAA